MPTLQSTLRAAPQPRRAITMFLTGLGALVAVGVAVLFLALTGPSTTIPAGHDHPSTYSPLIQYRGTGAPPASPAAQTRPAYIRAEHSYGAVP